MSEVIQDPEIIACLYRIGDSRYHYVSNEDYVLIDDNDESKGFRQFNGAAGFAHEYAYPIYRFDVKKLLKVISKKIPSGEGIWIGKEMLFCSLCPENHPDGPKTKVTILGKSPHGKDHWYFRKPNGGSDSTTTRFLLEVDHE